MWAALPRPGTWESQYLLSVLVPASSTLLTKHSLHMYQSWLPVTFHLWLRECSPLSLATRWLGCSAFYVITLAYYVFKREMNAGNIGRGAAHNMVETPHWSLLWGCPQAHSRNRQLLLVGTWNTGSPPLYPHLTLVLNPCFLDAVLFYRTMETLGGGTWFVEVGHQGWACEDHK